MKKIKRKALCSRTVTTIWVPTCSVSEPSIARKSNQSTTFDDLPQPDVERRRGSAARAKSWTRVAGAERLEPGQRFRIGVLNDFARATLRSCPRAVRVGVDPVEPEHVPRFRATQFMNPRVHAIWANVALG
jgi:hypothetical protein